jgi:hypothetical protein
MGPARFLSSRLRKFNVQEIVSIGAKRFPTTGGVWKAAATLSACAAAVRRQPSAIAERADEPLSEGLAMP